MTTWVLFALIPQFFWVFSTLIDKVLLEKYTSERGPLVLTLYSCLFSLCAAPLLVALDFEAFVHYHQGVPLLLASGVLNVLWIWLYLLALARDDASVVIPFFQVVPLFGVLLAYVTLGETLTGRGILGMFCMVLAAILLTVERLNYVAVCSRIGTLLIMIAASGVYATTNVLFKVGASDVSLFSALAWEHVGTLSTGLLLIGVSLATTSVFLRSLRANGVPLLAANGINEGFTAVGNGMFAYALLLGPVALVQSTNAVHPLLLFLIAAVLTRWAPSYYDEDIRKVWHMRLVALIVFAVGVFFLQEYLT